MVIRLLNLAVRVYLAGKHTFQVEVGPDSRSVSISLTRVLWPAGPVLNLSVAYPDGTSAGGASVAGGALLRPNGLSMNTAMLGLRQKGNGPLPAGTYTFTADVLQPITAAVTVERT